MEVGRLEFKMVIADSRLIESSGLDVKYSLVLVAVTNTKTNSD